MKIDIKDLMDDYTDVVNIDIPDAFGAQKGDPATGLTPQSRSKRPLLIAAALLLVVTAAAATPFVLSRTEGHGAMTEDGVSVESVQNSDLSGMLGSNLAPESVPAQTILPHAIMGEADIMRCYGNLLYVDGMYYSLTETGPESVELQNLNTTVELYGTWEINIDYAVIDGKLVFRNRLKESNGGEALTNDTTIRTSQIAYAEPLEGSNDTVMLTVRRSDKSVVETCRYPFFYNIFTGEITDPLANIPDLFEYGNMAAVQFNGGLTRALIQYFAIDTIYTGENVVGNTCYYICDLRTGEMTAVSTILEAYLPKVENSEVIIDMNRGGVWSNDDTVLLWISESTPYGSDHDGYSYNAWVYCIDLLTCKLCYKQQDVEAPTRVLNYNQQYIYGQNDFHVLDTETGICYGPDAHTNCVDWSETTERTALYDNQDQNIYLFHKDAITWSKISDAIALPTEGIVSVRLITNGWLCLKTAHGAYCYQIPESLPEAAMIEK